MDKLKLTSLTKKFGDITVVDNLNLTLRPGEFVSLLGPSGCGKTTTLRMIAGFVTPSAGTVEMDGKPMSSAHAALPPEKRRMSMIFQSYALWPNMTVEQNVAFGLKMRKVPKDEQRTRVARILEVVKLKHLAARYPNELSGGQQQRVSLARALVVQPEILLLDEPLSNLDANLREEMRSEIRRLHNEFGITSIYVTHDQSEAMTTSDRIAVMHKGRIEQIDDPLDALCPAEDALRGRIHRPLQHPRRQAKRRECCLQWVRGGVGPARCPRTDQHAGILAALAECRAACQVPRQWRLRDPARQHHRAFVSGRDLGLCVPVRRPAILNCASCRRR